MIVLFLYVITWILLKSDECKILKYLVKFYIFRSYTPNLLRVAKSSIYIWYHPSLLKNSENEECFIIILLVRITKIINMINLSRKQ